MTCGLWLAIFIYIKLTCAEKPWGDVGTANSTVVLGTTFTSRVFSAPRRPVNAL